MNDVQADAIKGFIVLHIVAFVCFWAGYLVGRFLT